MSWLVLVLLHWLVFQLLHFYLLSAMLHSVFTLLSFNIYNDNAVSCIYYTVSPTHITYTLLIMFSKLRWATYIIWHISSSPVYGRVTDRQNVCACVHLHACFSYYTQALKMSQTVMQKSPWLNLCKNPKTCIKYTTPSIPYKYTLEIKKLLKLATWDAVRQSEYTVQYYYYRKHPY